MTHWPIVSSDQNVKALFFTAAAYNGGGGGDTTRTLKLVKSPSSANQHLVFTGQMLILSPNQRYQGSEGKHKPSTGLVMSAYYHQRICVFALEQETEFETMKTLVDSVCVVQRNHISVVTWLLTDIRQGFTNGPITIATRVRFEYDSSTLRGFSCARIRVRYEHPTRIAWRRVIQLIDSWSLFTVA